MKRKRQETLIKLAFSELKIDSEKKAIEACPLDSESKQELELLSSIRNNLKKVGQATPDCSVSVERVRDAILNQNIKHTSPGVTYWSWASVTVAVCAIAFFANYPRHNPVEPRFVASLDQPSIIQPEPAGDTALLQPFREAQNNIEKPMPAPVSNPTRARRSPAVRYAVLTPTEDILTTGTKRAVEVAVWANRMDSVRSHRSVDSSARG